MTNMPLASGWSRWVADKRPSLIITAQAKLREVFFDGINTKVLAGIKLEHSVHVRLTGNNHILHYRRRGATVTSHLLSNSGSALLAIAATAMLLARRCSDR